MRSRSSETEDGAVGAQTSTSGADSCNDGIPTTNACSVSDAISLRGEYSMLMLEPRTYVDVFRRTPHVFIYVFIYVTNSRVSDLEKSKDETEGSGSSN